MIVKRKITLFLHINSGAVYFHRNIRTPPGDSCRKTINQKVEIPKNEEKREIEYLYIEADEDHVSLQEGGTASPKLIYIHESFEEVEGKDNSYIAP